jgi:hypothetical protein
MPDYYVGRVKDMLQLARSHGIVRDGMRVIELGTGWLHWEAITMRMFFNIEAVLFDVWDNRQLAAMKNYIEQLGARLGEFEDLVSEGQLAEARHRIDLVLTSQSFEQLYGRLGFEYVVESSGKLTGLDGRSFDLVVSRGVLEHVNRQAALALCQETHRIMRDDGWVLHSINIGDHLANYDSRSHPKLYLSFPEPLWKLIGQNEVQYINRLQRAEWIELFRSCGFEIVDEERAGVDISGLKLAARYREMHVEDLECTFVRLLMRKCECEARTVQSTITLRSTVGERC